MCPFVGDPPESEAEPRLRVGNRYLPPKLRMMSMRPNFRPQLIIPLLRGAETLSAPVSAGCKAPSSAPTRRCAEDSRRKGPFD